MVCLYFYRMNKARRRCYDTCENYDNSSANIHDFALPAVVLARI